MGRERRMTLKMPRKHSLNYLKRVFIRIDQRDHIDLNLVRDQVYGWLRGKYNSFLGKRTQFYAVHFHILFLSVASQSVTVDGTAIGIGSFHSVGGSSVRFYLRSLRTRVTTNSRSSRDAGGIPIIIILLSKELWENAGCCSVCKNSCVAKKSVHYKQWHSTEWSCFAVDLSVSAWIFNVSVLVLSKRLLQGIKLRAMVDSFEVNF